MRQTAITYLQRALLAHGLQSLSAQEWEACFLEVSEQRLHFDCIPFRACIGPGIPVFDLLQYAVSDQCRRPGNEARHFVLCCVSWARNEI